MSLFSLSRSSVLVLLVSVLCFSLLPVSLADDYCPLNCQNGAGDVRCDCGSCYCDNNNYPYCSGGCGTSGGAIAGIVIACIIAVGIALCLLSLCYRRRYYNYGGRTYGSGVTTVSSTAVPMSAVPVGGYANQQPMQAFPSNTRSTLPSSSPRIISPRTTRTAAPRTLRRRWVAVSRSTHPRLPHSRRPAYTAYPVRLPMRSPTRPSPPTTMARGRYKRPALLGGVAALVCMSVYDAMLRHARRMRLLSMQPGGGSVSSMNVSIEP